MKLILDKDIGEDWRDDICSNCGGECNPHYRFYYYSKEKDNEGNSMIDGEIQSCKYCKSKVKKMFDIKKGGEKCQ